MGDEITYLNIPSDAAEYARRFGALRDRSGQWFVVGLIPRELINFLPRQANPRFYEWEPPCPICGALMQKVMATSKNWLWLCTARRRTGCKGRMRYEEYLEKVEPTKTLGDYLPKLGTLLQPASPQKDPDQSLKPKHSHQLRERWIEIVRRAFEAIGVDARTKVPSLMS
jgi:hypothetical protein